MKRLPRKLTITVSLEDILTGARRSPCGCPVALAVRRVGATGVVVEPWWIVFKVNGIPCRPVDLPKEAREFIETFDAEGRDGVVPITFEVGPLKKIKNP